MHTIEMMMKCEIGKTKIFVDLIVSKSKIKMNTEFETLFNGFVLGLTKKLKKTAYSNRTCANE